jgi:glycosyltransferase involved in cell wall biosynthesis
MVNFRYGLIKYLLEQNYQIYIVAPFDQATSKLQALGCVCIEIKLDRKGTNPLKELKLIYDLYKIYKNIKPDIIFNYTIKPIIYGSIAARFAKIASIAVVTGLGFTFINKNLISKISILLYKIALRYPKMVWFLNKYDKNEFTKLNIIDKKRTIILPSEGVNLEHFSPAKRTFANKKLIFLLIARVLWDKGVGEYYEAAKLIKSRYKNSEFWLLGAIDSGNPKGVLEDIVKQWHDEKTIKYLGFNNDVRDYISQADCIVLPSYREGTSISLIEAGGMEKPLIASNVPGCNNVVKNGYNGFLCKAKDAKSLARAMEKIILLDKKSIEKLGRNSRQYMLENFDEKKVIKIYSDFLDKFYKTRNKL